MDDLISFTTPAQLADTMDELARCNEMTSKYGLALSDSQIRQLALHRFETLRATGRVEFGGGILGKLVRAFCDSPYLDQTSYVDTLAGLQELFYYFKKECREQVTDDELIEGMRLIFHRAGGSLDWLAGVDGAAMYRIARTGTLAGMEWEADLYDGEELS